MKSFFVAKTMHTLIVMLLATLAFSGINAYAEEQDSAQLAKALANPVAALISVPFQLNYDHKIGPLNDGGRWALNLQPVIPFNLNSDWNVISRTILPIIHQQDIFPGAGNQSGIGDIVQSVFFSPKRPSDSGWIWGTGPVFLLPTGSDNLLTADKWGVGPTGVMLRQQGPWTYGALANHIWSIGGDSIRTDVNATFIQPFMTYTTPDAWSYTLASESTYDWKAEKWSIPVNATVAKVTKVGDQLLSIGGGFGYWAKSPSSGPEGFRLRLTLTFLFPK